MIGNSNAGVNAVDRVETESRYDANGNVEQVVLHNRVDGVDRPQVTTYVYDALNRRREERSTVMVYSRAGDVLTVMDPEGQLIESDYDRAGRVSDQRFNDFVGGETGWVVEESRQSINSPRRPLFCNISAPCGYCSMSAARRAVNMLGRAAMSRGHLFQALEDLP